MDGRTVMKCVVRRKFFVMDSDDHSSGVGRHIFRPSFFVAGPGYTQRRVCWTVPCTGKLLGLRLVGAESGAPVVVLGGWKVGAMGGRSGHQAPGTRHKRTGTQALWNTGGAGLVDVPTRRLLLFLVPSGTQQAYFSGHWYLEWHKWFGLWLLPLARDRDTRPPRREMRDALPGYFRQQTETGEKLTCTAGHMEL